MSVSVCRFLSETVCAHTLCMWLHCSDMLSCSDLQLKTASSSSLRGSPTSSFNAIFHRYIFRALDARELERKWLPRWHESRVVILQAELVPYDGKRKGSEKNPSAQPSQTARFESTVHDVSVILTCHSVARSSYLSLVSKRLSITAHAVPLSLGYQDELHDSILHLVAINSSSRRTLLIHHSLTIFCK